MDQIEIGGVKYLASINFKVILDLQNAGISIADFKDKKKVDWNVIFKIIHMAIQDGYAAQGKLFELGVDDLMRQVMPKDLEGVMKFITGSKFLQGTEEMGKGTKKKVKEMQPSQ